jgi:hypothetical protein
MFTLGDGCYGKEFQAKRRQYESDAFFTSNDADYQNGGSSSLMTEFV